MLFGPKVPKPGDVRLWRRRGRVGDATLHCDDLIDAVAIADYSAAKGLPPVQWTVQRLGEDGEWSEVPETELAAVRAEEGT